MRLAHLSALVLFFTCAAVLAQEPAPIKPGAEHEIFKELAGEWDAQVKFFMEPGKPPDESKGSYSARLDVGGFFLVTDYKGTMFGSTFRGHGISGYDPLKKKYVGVWVDSMSPSIYHLEGTYDKSGKVLNEVMQGPDPMTGKTMKMRTSTEIKGKDEMTFKIFSVPEEGKKGDEAKEQLVMQIDYTRKKAK